jgi:chromate transporter
VAHSDVPAITGLLYGIQPVVIAIVVEAVLRIARRALNHYLLIGFSVAAFVALFFFSIPFPLVVLAAGLGGLLLSRAVPEAFQGGGHGSSAEEESAVDRVESEGRPPMLRNLRLLATFLVLWAVPVGAVGIWRGGEDVLFREALFFTGAAFVTFGGAYAVLSYVADVAVNQYGWLTADQMVQGLGLAESTPGPLIMVTQYVGFIGAWNDPGPFAPLLYGTLGALITTYATFLPCFLFIFLLAPYIELLANNRRLGAVLVGVTAAVVGVIANLAVYFATQVLFPDGVSVRGLDVYALVVAVVSFIVLQRFRVPIYLMVPAGAVVGMAWTLL